MRDAVLQPSRLRVLVVDDHEAQRLAISAMLAAIGVTVDFAEDGAEAVAAAQSMHYDLILMDVVMPRMDGLNATQMIRQNEGRQARTRTPLYVVSARDREEDRQAAIAFGADGYIAKPPPILRLVQAVNHGRARAERRRTPREPLSTAS